ncbi:MAG: PAS domain S-box protein [Gemmatimonadetes bacterium]|nr:PAS domain S-box protein [Gemmatimonadota bacterium]
MLHHDAAAGPAQAAALVIAAAPCPVAWCLTASRAGEEETLLRLGVAEVVPAEAGVATLERALARAEARGAYQRGARAREALYEGLVEHDAAVPLLVDADLSIRWVAGGIRALTGHAAADLVGRPVRALLGPAGLPQLRDLEQWASAHPGQVRVGPLEVRHADGHDARLEASVVQLAQLPAVGGLVVRLREAPAEDERTQRLAESEARFRSIAEETPVPVWLEDPARNLIYENRTALEFVGRTFEEEQGQGWLAAVHPDDVERVRAHYDWSSLQQRDVTLEFRMRRHDGAWRDLLQIAIPRWDDRGRYLGFLGVDIDITEIKAKAARTEAAEERYRLFVEQSTEGIWRFEIDPPVPVDLDPEAQVARMFQDAVLAECNPTMARMYGFANPAELEGRRLHELLSPDDPQNHAYLLAFITSGYRLTDAESHERDREGRFKVFLNNLVGIIEEGRVARAWGLQRDITERKVLEEEARQARKMEATGRLAGGIAHDFNNLLTAILGTTQLLLEDLPAGSTAHGDVEEIRRAAVRAANLTRQLLAFSRRQVLQPRVLDVEQLLRGVDSLIRRLIGEHIDLRIRSEPGLWPVKADPGQLEQVLVNLCVNARDAMPTGGGLEIAAENLSLTAPPPGTGTILPPGRYVLLTVRDTGSGMDEATLRHLFEPFFTTKAPGQGTGLGLATVYGIVKQSGGYIFVDSALGEGSRFRIYLPQAEGRPEAPPAADRPEAARGQGRVLVVEDEEAVRRLTRRVLEGAGYTITEAADGPAALAAVAAAPAPFDLVVSDVIMPGMSGQELARQLLARQPGLRILYVSGYSDEAILPLGRLPRGTAFLQKPFEPAVLLARVREVLGP